MKHIIRRLSLFPFLALAVVFALSLRATPVQAAEPAEIENFLEVTGFDTALESIKFNAESAPAMLGLEPGQFGEDWTRLAEAVFNTRDMHDMAMEFLTALLDDDMLDHAVAFYASDLGQRLVEVENAAHLEDAGEAATDEGLRLLSEMESDPGNVRLDLFQRMQNAIDASGAGLRALQEVQIRFLLTASAAGVIELRIDEDGLRALMREQAAELKEAMEQGGLASSAYTYRSFSDADVRLYVEALEHPTMQKVYELLNAVQFQITANRFEVLAVRMADLHPVQDL